MAENDLTNRTEPVEAAVSIKETTPQHVNGLAIVRSTEEALAIREGELEIKKPVVIDNLASHIRSVWAVCRDGRKDITEILEECRRQRNGEYDPELKARLDSQGGSQSYHNITNHKCASAEGWINEMASTDNPWSIDPTPVPEINPDLYEVIATEVAEVAEQYYQSGQELSEQDVISLAEDTRLEYDKTIQAITDKAAQNMTRIMEDQFLEGKWKRAFREFVRDFVTYPIGIMKFEMKNKVATAFKEDENGNWILATEPKLYETWRRVNPLNFYPAPNIADVEDGDICEKISFSRKDLTSMSHVDGYNKEAIQSVLKDFGNGGLKDWTDQDFYQLNYQTDKDAPQQHGMGSLTIDAVEFHGSVQGSILKEWGMSGIKDDYAEHEVWAILIDKYIIVAQLNPHPLGHKPYYTCPYERDPDSIWGKGIAQKVRQSQLDANQSRRALLNNISLSSGPQVMVNQSHLSASEDIQAIYPYKIWKMRRSKQSETFNIANVFRFFQPASHSAELMETTRFFANEADEDSGIPKVAEGAISNSFNNAASTASGLSMILDNASRNLRNVISNIDEYVIQKQVDDLYMLNMLDPTIPNDAKGDLVVRARGILSTGLREKLQVLRKEFMMMVLDNEMLTNLLGPDGIADLLREVAKPLDMNVGFIPSKEKVEQEQVNAQEEQQRQDAMVADIVNRVIEAGFMTPEDAEKIITEQRQELQQSEQ